MTEHFNSRDCDRSGTVCVRPFMERSTAAMEKKDGGFTLIELLIALAVLSIMAGVLLQSFVVSRRMNTKARKDELLCWMRRSGRWRN